MDMSFDELDAAWSEYVGYCEAKEEAIKAAQAAQARPGR